MEGYCIQLKRETSVLDVLVNLCSRLKSWTRINNCPCLQVAGANSSKVDQWKSCDQLVSSSTSANLPGVGESSINVAATGPLTALTTHVCRVTPLP